MIRALIGRALLWFIDGVPRRTGSARVQRQFLDARRCANEQAALQAQFHAATRKILGVGSP